MKILITGGAGFLGSQIARLHYGAGREVTVVDNLSTGTLGNIPVGAEYIICDVGVESSARLIGENKYDRVYHFASPASPDVFLGGWRGIVEANVQGMLMAVSAVKRDGLLVVASSSEAYGQPKGAMAEFNLGAVRTQSIRGVYDESKRLIEAMAYSAAAEKGCRSLVVRIFNTYGPGMPDDGRVINTFLRQAQAGEALTVHGDGLQSRSFGYIGDTVSQIMQLAKHVNERHALGDCHVFNVGNDQERTVMDAARIVSDLTGARISLVPSPRPHDPTWRRADMSKTMSAIGPMNLWSLEEGIKLCVS